MVKFFHHPSPVREIASRSFIGVFRSLTSKPTSLGGYLSKAYSGSGCRRKVHPLGMKKCEVLAFSFIRATASAAQ